MFPRLLKVTAHLQCKGTASSQPRVTSHQVRVVDGRFCSAECTCGWRSAGRRHRTTVRAEARDHALLYADGRILTVDDEA